MLTKEKKTALCERNKELFWVMYRVGWGNALQPLLVAILVEGRAYKSAAMVRKSIAALINAGILKWTTWVDGNAHVLIFKKYAFEFCTGLEREQFSSYRVHSTNQTYLQSACRMQFFYKVMLKNNFNILETFTWFDNVSSSMFLRQGELLDYWEKNWHLSKSYGFELELLKESQTVRRERLHSIACKKANTDMTKPDRPSIDEVKSIRNLEDLFLRGIFVHSFLQSRIILMIFNTSKMSGKKVVDRFKAVLDWYYAQGLEEQGFILDFVVACSDEVAVKIIKNDLEKKIQGEPYWRHCLSQYCPVGRMPLRIVSIGILEDWSHGIVLR